MTSKPGIPSPVIDVELLAEALHDAEPTPEVMGHPWADCPVRDVTRRRARAVAEIYTRLASESSIPVEEGE